METIIKALEIGVSNITWSIVLWDFVFVSLLLIAGTILRSKVKLFQKWLIPNAILAGTIGLFLSSGVLGRLTNGLLYIPFSENIVFYPYHLLNLCYCSIPLSAAKISWKEFRNRGLSTGLCISFTQATQAAFGVGLALIFIVLGFKLSPLIGTLFMFGFGTGPGQAFAIGNIYEKLGLFVGGGEIGLAFGSIGYFIAFLGGVPLLIWGMKNRLTMEKRSMSDLPKHVRTGIIKDEKDRKIAGWSVSSPEAIDTFTLQIVLVFAVYAVSFLIYILLIIFLPTSASTYLSGFLYMICTMTSILFRVILDKTGKTYLIDFKTQNRIQGVLTDFIIVIAISAVSIPIVWMYFTPFITIAILGGAFTIILSVWLHKRIFTDYYFERLMMNYGTHTGTAMTGLALMRVVDPDFKSPSPVNYTMGMPLALIVQFVIASLGGFIISINPFALWTGVLYFLILVVICIIIWLMWPTFGLWKKYKPFWKLWPKD